MTLLEFISFCQLKGRVTSHGNLTSEFFDRSNGITRRRVRIQARGYEAFIDYTEQDGETTIFSTTLFDYGPCHNSRRDDVPFEEIVKCVLGPKIYETT